jgi:hypothetical protein
MAARHALDNARALALPLRAMSFRYAPLALALLSACGSENPSPAPTDASTDSPAPPPPPPPVDGSVMDVPGVDGPLTDAPPPPPPPPPTDVPGIACTRLTAPASTTRVTSRRPSLQYAVGGGLNNTRIDLCRDRACAMLVEQITSNEDYVNPRMELAPGVYFWRAVNRTPGGGECASPTWEFTVPARSGMTDTAWGTALDVNGDGYGDLAVGSGAAATGNRVVKVFHGGPSGLATMASATLQGMGLGRVVASAGDVNGDGFGDLALSSTTASGGAGVVSIYQGAPAGVPAMASLSITGPDGASAEFGAALAGVGDTDGDGRGDVVVGSPRVGAGRVHLFLGSNEGLVAAPARTINGPDGAGSGYGTSVAGGGDIDADGFGDVLVGAPCAPRASATAPCGGGRVYYYRGGAFSIQMAATQVLDAPSGVEGFGTAIAGAGDLNGDGRADVVVAAPAMAGSVFVYLTGRDGRLMTPPTRLQVMGATNFGQTVASAGDVNADGYSDLLVASPSASTAWLFAGASAGLTTTPTTTWTAPGSPMTMSLFGATGASAGDVNRDGFSDVVVGDPVGAGLVHVYAGSMAGAPGTPSNTLRGAAGEMLGAALGGATSGL